MNTKNNLEKELWLLDKALENEKTKRAIILWVVNSLLVGVLLYAVEGISSTIELLALIGSSLFLGGCLFCFSTVSFVLVSNLFTNIDAMESRKKYLEEEIRKYR